MSNSTWAYRNNGYKSLAKEVGVEVKTLLQYGRGTNSNLTSNKLRKWSRILIDKRQNKI
ncbi:MAG TPA: hypothetical protein VFD65_04380 [Chitinophagales bacterium]|nr:hypothetical protein [Chitinophagales bacterium]